MAQSIQDIMTKDIHAVPQDTSLLDVAKLMRDKRIGDVLVTKKDGTLCGIVTDRDIVVRADAAGRSLDGTKAGDICTGELVKIEPSQSIDDAVKIMRTHSVRRVPVVSQGKAVGIVSIGDLARHKDPTSALAQLSSAEPNN